MAFKTYKAQVKLLPGQKVGFRKGRGYFADSGGAPAPYPGGGPAEPKSGAGGNPYAPPVRPRVVTAAPAPPPASADPYAALSQSEIDRRAGELAQAGLTPQQEEVRRQQALAAKQARADEGAITGLQTASAGILAGLGPQAEQGFLDASKQEGALGQGLATGVQQDVASRVAADQTFAESQGQSGGSTIDPTALHDTVYGLTGEIPGNTFAEQGAAMNAWGLAQAPIALNAGREELDARMAQARQSNDEYAQQLIQLAAQYPGLKAQALQQLNQYEMDKATYRDNVRVHTEDIAHTRRSDALAARSERAQELAAHVNASNDAKALQYKWAALSFQTEKAMAAAKAAQAKGKRIDVQASKLLGHLVFQDGSEDPSIKVGQTGSAADGKTRQKALATRAKDTSKARKTAFDFATKLRGAPVKAPKGSKGAYVAAPGQKYGVPGGVFPPAYPGAPATTNDPDRAGRAGGASNYADAQSKVWAEIDGDGLMARFGYSREQVMAIINDGLSRAGWKRK